MTSHTRPAHAIAAGIRCPACWRNLEQRTISMCTAVRCINPLCRITGWYFSWRMAEQVDKSQEGRIE